MEFLHFYILLIYPILLSSFFLPFVYEILPSSLLRLSSIHHQNPRVFVTLWEKKKTTKPHKRWGIQKAQSPESTRCHFFLGRANRHFIPLAGHTLFTRRSLCDEWRRGGGRANRGNSARERKKGIGCSKRGWIIYSVTVFRGCCVRCCQVGGSAGLRQFAFICGFLTTPPFHGSPSDQIRISRAAVSHLRRPNLAFFARDIISGSVTHCCQSRFVFSFPFFLSLFSLFFFFFWTIRGPIIGREIYNRNDLLGY